MKKPAIIATITAGVVILGGGGYALGTMNSSEPETVAVKTPAPTKTVEVTVTPDPIVVTPTPETTPTTEPEQVPAPADEERDPRVVALQDGLAGWGITSYSDAEVIAAADDVCAQLAAGVNKYDISVLPNEGKAVDGEFVYTARSYC